MVKVSEETDELQGGAGMDRETRMVVSRAGDGEIRKMGQRVQTSSYKMGKFWSFNVQHGDNS